MVDLDGAVLGEPKNIEYIEAIVKAVDIPVQTGGGIRNMETLQRLCDAGVSRAVLGTTLVTEPEFVADACADFDGVVAGIDAREGKVAIDGWKQGTERGVLELVHELELLGVTARRIHRHLPRRHAGRHQLRRLSSARRPGQHPGHRVGWRRIA